MNERFFKRINYNGKLEDMAQKICADFNMGEFQESEIITMGYEDFNLLLRTKRGNYLVKIFANSRPDSECERIVDINKIVMDGGVAVPRLIESKGEYFHRMKIDGVDLRFCVFEYIDGDNLFTLKHKVNEDEVRFLARQAALTDSLDIKPEFIYDNWAITSFDKEFENKKEYLQEDELEIMKSLVDNFRALDFEKLPHCFIHGDIISPNVIMDKSNNLWMIDFSVSNYYPRIQELAVLACDIFFDENDETNSQKNLKIALEEYQKIIKLIDYELEVLPLYIKFAHAMHALSANHEKIAYGNNSKENEYFLRIGRAGLKNN